MSLIVYAYKRDPATGEMLDLDVKPTPPRNDLAGFEAWRQMASGAVLPRVIPAAVNVCIPALERANPPRGGRGPAGTSIMSSVATETVGSIIGHWLDERVFPMLRSVARRSGPPGKMKMTEGKTL